MAADYYAIQKLQAGLKLLGYDVGRIDGAAGDITSAQIRKFLKDNNITDTNPRNVAQVLDKVRQKTLSDPGVNERLMNMAKNPAALGSEDLRMLQGGMALRDMRTGPGRDRIMIDGKMGPQTAEAAASLSIRAQTATRFVDNKSDITIDSRSSAPALRVEAAKAATPAAAPSGKMPDLKQDSPIDERNYSVEQRRAMFANILPEAARHAHLPTEYLGAVIGAESDFGRDVTSKSGCMGLGQFEKKTFAAVLKNHGDKIVSDLREKGLNNLADKVESYTNEMKGIKNIWKTSMASISNQEMQDLRFDPRVNLLASAYLNEENAKALKIDLNNKSTWGLGYAAYNLGVQGAKTLRSDHWAESPHVMGQIKAAITNDSFFVNPKTGLMDATGQQVLDNYAVRMFDKAQEFRDNFNISNSVMAERVTSTAPAQKTDTAGKPFGPMEDFRTAAWGATASSDRVLSPVLVAFKNAGQEMIKPNDPPKLYYTPHQPTLTM